LGAEVIKVESMAMPDSARGLGTSPARGMGGMFVGTGRSKQSVMLNLKTKAGVDTFLGEFSPKKNALRSPTNFPTVLGK
jgi:crotonobetainyl-CoA:carnitine CoA-transferase CaiB-like acyl-CoA transferase